MFKGLGNLGNMGNMLKQAMEVKERMEALKEQLGDERVEASVGGGLVTLVMTGKFEVVDLQIDPELIAPDQQVELETLLRSAFNEGVQKTQAMIKERMQQLTGGIDIPGLTS